MFFNEFVKSSHGLAVGVPGPWMKSGHPALRRRLVIGRINSSQELTEQAGPVVVGGGEENYFEANADDEGQSCGPIGCLGGI